jgi:hypothetical protein
MLRKLNTTPAESTVRVEVGVEVEVGGNIEVEEYEALGSAGWLDGARRGNGAGESN